MFAVLKRKGNILKTNKVSWSPQAFHATKKEVETRDQEMLSWPQTSEKQPSPAMLSISNSQFLLCHWKHSFSLAGCVNGSLAQKKLNQSLLHVQFLSSSSSHKRNGLLFLLKISVCTLFKLKINGNEFF